MKNHLTLFLILVALGSCKLKLKSTEINRVNGTLTAHFSDSSIMYGEDFMESPSRVLLVLKKNFIRIMPKEELETFLEQTQKSFLNDSSIMDLSRLYNLKFSTENDVLILSDPKLKNYDYILVLDSLVDNINYLIPTYVDSLGQSRIIPNICYPDTNKCNSKNEFDDWAYKKYIKIEPLQVANTENLKIELIYGYTRTMIYSGESGKLLGELNLFLSDFDFNPNIPFTYTSTLKKYNRPIKKHSDANFKLHRINQELFVQLNPTGVYGLFEFGELFGKKLSNSFKKIRLTILIYPTVSRF